MQAEWREVVGVSQDNAFLQGLIAPLAAARCTLHPVRDVRVPSTVPFLQNADAAIVELQSILQPDSSYLARLLRALRVPYLVVKRPGPDREMLGELQAGALGSLPAPLDGDELIARLGLLFASPRPGRYPSKFVAPDVVVDTFSSIIACQDRVVDLTAQETVLLHYLLTSPGRIIGRSLLCQCLGVPSDQHGHSIVRQGISRLRRKLGNDATGSLNLLTEGRVGYRLELRVTGNPAVQPRASVP